ncbi:MAG: hypothetical protein KC413_05885, partial [Anaerolineales bacterium]|nr:hypothetical protein [Anaerolineales bacterium]
ERVGTIAEQVGTIQERVGTIAEQVGTIQERSYKTIRPPTVLAPKRQNARFLFSPRLRASARDFLYNYPGNYAMFAQSVAIISVVKICH